MHRLPQAGRPQPRKDLLVIVGPRPEVDLRERDARFGPVPVDVVRVVVHELLVARVGQHPRDLQSHVLDEPAAYRAVGEVQAVRNGIAEQQFVRHVVALDAGDVRRAGLAAGEGFELRDQCRPRPRREPYDRRVVRLQHRVDEEKRGARHGEHEQRFTDDAGEQGMAGRGQVLPRLERSGQLPLRRPLA